MSYKEPSRIPMEKPLVRNNAYVDSGTVLSEFRNSVWSVCWKQVSPEMSFRTCDYCVTISSIALLFLLASNQIPAKVLHTQLDCMKNNLDIDWD